MSAEVARPLVPGRTNRAIAAVKDARGDSVAPLAAGLPSLGLCRPFDASAPPVVRYASFADMLSAVRQPDPLAALKEKLASMAPVPTPVNEAARLSDAAWYQVMDFVGATRTRDVVPLSATCRRLRTLALQHSARTRSLATVSVVPRLLALPDLGDHATCGSVAAFLSAPGRAPHVRHLALVESKYASTLPWQQPHFPAPCALSPILALVARLPALTTLDLRGVAWDCRGGVRLSLLLPDLYLVSPQLETLKIGLEVMPLWQPRWWERLPHLRALVIASRREQPLTSAVAAGGAHPQEESAVASASSAPVSAVPPLLELSGDFMEMLSAEARQWSIKLWCPLTAASALQLLFPATPHTNLVELTVNAAGPAAAVLLQASTTASHATGGTGEPASEGSGKKTKAKKSIVPDVEVPLLPALTTLTVANADVLPNLVPQLFQRLSSAMAPNLVHINICNTVCAPPSEKKLKKKAAAPTDAS